MHRDHAIAAYPVDVRDHADVVDRPATEVEALVGELGDAPEPVEVGLAVAAVAAGGAGRVEQALALAWRQTIALHGEPQCAEGNGTRAVRVTIAGYGPSADIDTPQELAAYLAARSSQPS